MNLLTVHANGKTRSCDANCYNARKPHCECVCGGLNHAQGLFRALVNTDQYGYALVETVLHKDPDAQVLFAVPDPNTDQIHGAPTAMSVSSGLTCPACYGPMTVLGDLGALRWYRCRNCGMEATDGEWRAQPATRIFEEE